MEKRNASALFSVVIPVYNREERIIDALNSIKTQTYRPIEIIVVDDGSTDNTASVINSWAQANAEPSLVTLYSFQQNAGPGAARNRGIHEITGQFVQFLDSDDRLHSERMEILAETFHRTGADFILTGFQRIDDDTGEVIVKKYGRPNQNQVELALEGFLWANTLRAAFSAKLVQRIGPWDTTMTCFEDREYVERACTFAEKPIAIKDILATAGGGQDDRLSDKLRSHEGRGFRILCEERLAKYAFYRDDISNDAKRAFRSRIYGLGFRSLASGWPDHSARCGDLANSLEVDLDMKGKIRRSVWRSGRFGAIIYIALGQFKRALSMK